MNRVVSLNGHGGDAIRYHYAAQAAGKRLLILMGMVKNTRCQDSAVGRHHIPFMTHNKKIRDNKITFIVNISLFSPPENSY